MALELFENEAIQIANKMPPSELLLDLGSMLSEHPRNRW
jgi:hypothetical protein